MSQLETHIPFALCLAFSGVSFVMAVFPERVAAYVRNSAMWRVYLRLVSNLEPQDLTAKRLRIRLQGLVGLAFSLLVLLAMVV